MGERLAGSFGPFSRVNTFRVPWHTSNRRVTRASTSTTTILFIWTARHAAAMAAPARPDPWALPLPTPGAKFFITRLHSQSVQSRVLPIASPYIWLYGVALCACLCCPTRIMSVWPAVDQHFKDSVCATWNQPRIFAEESENGQIFSQRFAKYLTSPSEAGEVFHSAKNHSRSPGHWKQHIRSSVTTGKGLNVQGWQNGRICLHV